MTNAELATALRELRDFLIIAGYEESHALRYTHISRTIEKLPEAVEDLKLQGRLQEIPGVGKLVAQYIGEILDSGRTSKVDEWLEHAPWSVVELTKVPGLGVKTASRLWHDYGLGTLADAQKAAREGRLDEMKGFGPKLREALLATTL